MGLFIDFDIEYVNAGEFFEQYAFAFHYRFTGQCADVAQTQHCSTIGNHGNQIAFGGVFVGILRIGMDFIQGAATPGEYANAKSLEVARDLVGVTEILPGTGNSWNCRAASFNEFSICRSCLRERDFTANNSETGCFRHLNF